MWHFSAWLQHFLHTYICNDLWFLKSGFVSSSSVSSLYRYVTNCVCATVDPLLSSGFGTSPLFGMPNCCMRETLQQASGYLCRTKLWSLPLFLLKSTVVELSLPISCASLCAIFPLPSYPVSPVLFLTSSVAHLCSTPGTSGTYKRNNSVWTSL